MGRKFNKIIIASQKTGSSTTVEVLRSAEGIELCWCLIDVATINVTNLIVKGVVQFTPFVEFEQFTLHASTIQVIVSFSMYYISFQLVKLTKCSSFCYFIEKVIR